jgi:hypothetical protein
VLFLSATLLALTLRFYQQMGLTRVTVSFGLVSARQQTPQLNSLAQQQHSLQQHSRPCSS